ncbi:DUF5060 domain-containing protein [uncultured Kriegella sp.]|uniref:DUF5060 domain-containing protein n=1 Tax=uncultured Kriegella sp. TaxID=1798910 RepID=UPI0030D84015|tara:strand:+ start:52996 stop:54642 length:1647 start_codon:yes stop_codon:yes gene_type:complete
MKISAKKGLVILLILPTILFSQKEIEKVAQWTTHEITLTAAEKYKNPYTDVDVWAIYTNSSGDSLKRPAFWNGGNDWKIRFSPPDINVSWTWKTFSSNREDTGLNGKKGGLYSIPYAGKNRLIKNGLLKMSAAHRGVVHQSGKSFFMVGDTPWAMPFRATLDQVEAYAKDRQVKGFNTALIMTLQPDVNAEGPNVRNVEQGFKRAFKDLSNGHINEIDLEYFNHLDELVVILLNHEIVPVYQPVFHGFGWKGLQVLGSKIAPHEYVRYTKYLLARYGSSPAFWLIAADHDANDPGVRESGAMLENWDCYQQPTGLHYNPCDDFVAEWAKNDPSKHCMHYNKTHQKEQWLDFQWAQTGHSGDHQYHKVARMYDNLPTKAVANGESTYEGMNAGKNGLGWWQGEDAWMQLMHGGTMGVVYGAAALWQWKVSANEEGWGAWADQPLSWKSALKLEGAKYVGLIGKILRETDMADIEKRWDLADGLPLLAKEGELYLSYLQNGGVITIKNLPQNLNYSWKNPKTGKTEISGITTKEAFEAPDKNPWVLLIRQ